MSYRRFDMLSERQKQCLRLYYANLEIKEIAARLSLSPNTVKEHLRDARRLLCVSRSMQAARIFVDHERDTHGVSPPKRVGLKEFPSDKGAAEAMVMRSAAARNRYNLGILQRIGLIVAIAFIAVALGGSLLVGADAITRIFVEYGIDISDKPYRE